MKPSVPVVLGAAVYMVTCFSPTNAGITTWDDNAACMPDDSFVEAWSIYNETNSVHHGCWNDPEFGYWTMLKGFVDTDFMEDITWRYLGKNENAADVCLRGWTYYNKDGWIVRPFVKTILWGNKPWCALPVYARRSSVPFKEGKTWAYCGKCVADGDNPCATCVVDYAQHDEL